MDTYTKCQKKKVKSLLSIAKDNVKDGIYAVKKDNYVELKRDSISDKQKLKEKIAKYTQQGFIVYYNARGN